jgi:hypothetical protein
MAPLDIDAPASSPAALPPMSRPLLEAIVGIQALFVIGAHFHGRASLAEPRVLS